MRVGSVISQADPFHPADQEAAHLPSFGHFRFSPFAPEPLPSRLRNLSAPSPSTPSPPQPRSWPSSPNSTPSSPLLAIMEGLLKMSASQRMSAREALELERWKVVEVLKPLDMGGGGARAGGEAVAGKSLGKLLREVVPL